MQDCIIDHHGEGFAEMNNEWLRRVVKERKRLRQRGNPCLRELRKLSYNGFT